MEEMKKVYIIKKTREYYERLKKYNIKGNYIYKKYKGFGHGIDTMREASYDLIKWLQNKI